MQVPARAAALADGHLSPLMASRSGRKVGKFSLFLIEFIQYIFRSSELFLFIEFSELFHLCLSSEVM